MSAPTDEQLLAEYLEGDKTAFRKLVQRHHKELYRFAHRLTGSGAAAEDVVQTTFLQVHLSGSSFDTSRRLKPWLFTIAANKARDHLRARSRRREVPLDAQIGGDESDSGQRFLDLLADQDSDPVTQVADDEHRLIVREVVSHMPENLSEILILAYFHKCPYKEIAEMLDIPLGTVKSRLHAAVAHFGERYKALCKDQDTDNQ